MTRHRLCILAGAVAAMASLQPASPRVALAAPDNTLGMALLGANIAHDGMGGAILLQGSGVTGVVHPETGVFRVSFDRNVAGCFTAATVVISAEDYFIQASPSGTFVDVLITGPAGPVDNQFSLIVYCHR